MKFERGGFALGVVVGLLVGLSLALAVALYITKAPVPFVNKVPQRTAEQDQAEVERNRKWDPNAPLAGKAGKPAAGPASAASASAAPTAAPEAPPAAPRSAADSPPATSAPAALRPARDPAAILAGAPTPAASATGAASAPGARAAEPFVYFVQAGAYTRPDEAEQQRAKLALLGLPAKITEREQQGRTVYRVRMGPFEARPEAESLLGKLQESNIEAQLVRVERP